MKLPPAIATDWQGASVTMMADVIAHGVDLEVGCWACTHIGGIVVADLVKKRPWVASLPIAAFVTYLRCNRYPYPCAEKAVRYLSFVKRWRDLAAVPPPLDIDPARWATAGADERRQMVLAIAPAPPPKKGRAAKPPDMVEHMRAMQNRSC